MDKKNLLLAAVLWVMLLMGYSYYIAWRDGNQPAPVDTSGAEQPGEGATPAPSGEGSPGETPAGAPIGETGASGEIGPGGSPPEPEPEVQAFVLESDLLKLGLTSRGGVVTSAVLKDYSDYRASVAELAEKPTLDLLQAFMTESRALGMNLQDAQDDLTQRAWRATPVTRGVRFQTRYKGLELVKIFTLPVEGRHLEVELTIKNLGAETWKGGYSLEAATAIKQEEPTSRELVSGIAGVGSGEKVELEVEDSGGLPAPGATKEDRVEFHNNTMFGGSASKYFAMILMPEAKIREKAMLRLTKTEGQTF
ncbi:MAG: membrane protein insertase YidC, partial [Planctomycetota bacterium]